MEPLLGDQSPAGKSEPKTQKGRVPSDARPPAIHDEIGLIL